MPETPVLLSPENEALNQPTDITFDWENAANATEYIIEYADNPEFNSSIENTSSASEYFVSGLILDQTYYWRVYSSDGINISEWSDTRSFTTGLMTLDIPVLISPVNGVVEQLTELTLDWNSVSGATSYEYQYSTDNTFATYNNGTISNTEVLISGLEYDTEYFWRIQATDGSQFSEWSEVWSFTTKNYVGLSDIGKNELITIYPNPTTGIFTIQGKGIQSIQITNISGQIVKQLTINNEQFTIDLSNYSKGIYFINIQFDNKKISKKIIVN